MHSPYRKELYLLQSFLEKFRRWSLCFLFDFGQTNEEKTGWFVLFRLKQKNFCLVRNHYQLSCRCN